VSAPGRPWMPRVFLIAGLVLACCLAVAFWYGHEYYLLEHSRKPLHPSHPDYRSSGRVGLLLGIGGASLAVLNLTYMVRKRLLPVDRFGTLRSWMGFHVFTGLAAIGVVLFHTSFELRSALGILSILSMVAVVATGLLGRYIYSQVPRSLQGHELNYEDSRRRLLSLITELGRHGLEIPPLPRRTLSSEEKRPGALRTLITVLLGDASARREYRQLRATVLGSEALRGQARQLLPLLRGMWRERLSVLRYHELRVLMGSWRFFHLWLALLMIVVLLSHVGIGFWYGNLHLPFGGS
jgi:hypothetical protein